MGPAVRDRILFAAIGTLCLVLSLHTGQHRAETAIPGSEAAYDALLRGDVSLLADSGTAENWRFCWEVGGLEYGFQDLDGDGSDELLVQMEDGPGGMNAVFHYNGERIDCWELDAVEMNCYTEPLTDGAMVRQYFYGDCRSFWIFRYGPDGTQNELHYLFARDELVNPEDRAPCPYYEVDGRAVSEEKFNWALRKDVLEKRWNRADWIPLL